MQTKNDLERILARIDGRGYPAYKDTRGAYDMGSFLLSIDHVQGDPFAAPSDVSVEVRNTFPKEAWDTKEGKRALEDLLTRKFSQELKKVSNLAGGSGKSGKMDTSRPGQEVLERTVCTITPEKIRMRFNAGFPAQGRKVLARQLQKMLTDYVPKVVQNSLDYNRYSEKEKEQVKETWQLAEDQASARKQLKEKGLAAFVANGSILPRKSGVSDKPMEGAVPFESPESLLTVLDLPHRGAVAGMGIPNGITLIAGGGYHGKSTLLEALETGVYDHIAGDGRELVFADDSAVKSRAEDGRSVKAVNISGFIQDLPSGKSTENFDTEDASGSTSQAAGIVEAIQGGSRLLLIDEDTSAGNFMIRDNLMQEVIATDQEPIIPFIDRVRELYEKEGVSTILVAGSSGSFFNEADLVLQMDHYKPKDITQKAKEAAQKYHLSRREYLKPLDLEGHRIPQPVQESAKSKVKSRGLDSVSIDRQEIDLRLVEQLVDPEQMSAIGQLLRMANRKYIDGKKTIAEVADLIEADLDNLPMDQVMHGRAARPRRQEILAALNRQRYMDIVQKDKA